MCVLWYPGAKCKSSWTPLHCELRSLWTCWCCFWFKIHASVSRRLCLMVQWDEGGSGGWQWRTKCREWFPEFPEFVRFDHCELSGSSWEFLFYEISLSHLLVCYLTNRQILKDFKLSWSPCLSLLMASVGQRYMPTACEKTMSTEQVLNIESVTM